MTGTNFDHPTFHGLENRFPEKTYYLGQVFRNTTNSYKLVWFLAILSLLQQLDSIYIKLEDIFVEMLMLAWHPVCLYRLSLGKQDKLQNAVLKLKERTDLLIDADCRIIKDTIKSHHCSLTYLNFLQNYVPMRFLSPWFSKQLKGRKDSEKNSLIRVLARQSQNASLPTPYYLDDSSTSIILNKSWKIFLLENLGIIQAFAEYHFALYLQTRNPNVPGIICKLHAPTKRQLTTARNFWTFVRAEFMKHGWQDMFMDIYSLNPLYDSFSVDHFLPWSFVAHDLVWNLTPVEKSTNSMKSDKLPDLKIYIPRLAKLHYKSMRVSLNRPRFLEDYIICFKEEPQKLLSLGERGLIEKYYQIMGPQAQIAINQGFQSNWVYMN